MNEKELYKLLGVNVKSYRNRSGWSQAELAGRISLSVWKFTSCSSRKKYFLTALKNY
jgi:transcriptional regulator with XRE-family HTH domain